MNPSPRLNRLIMHSGFWIAWMSRTFYDIVNLFGWQGAFTYSFSYICTQVPFVYFHLYVLVPRFLNKRKYAIYIPATIASLFCYSYLSYYILQSLDPAWVPTMTNYIRKINPNYDILEGLFAYIITYALKYTWMALNSQNRILELQKTNLQLELNALKSQINPHFLFNTLNNLYALAMQKSDKAPEMILRLSNMMRYLLYECNSAQVPMQKEIEFLHNYIELEKIRHHEHVRIHFTVNGNPEGRIIEPFLLIPLIENAFKHGAHNRQGTPEIDIVLDCKESELGLKISNPLRATKSSEPGGIGISNLSKRLELLYPGKHALEIVKSGDTYTASLTIRQAK